jgi:hypothetical protein
MSDRDETRWLTYLSIGGLLASGVLVLIGGFPFDLPMPTHSFGRVSATCGLTRGSTAVARGDLALAWRYNPASFLVMGLGVAGVVRFSVGVVTGRWLNLRVRPGRLAWAAIALLVIALALYQQTNAEFIIHSRA